MQKTCDGMLIGLCLKVDYLLLPLDLHFFLILDKLKIKLLLLICCNLPTLNRAFNIADVVMAHRCTQGCWVLDFILLNLGEGAVFIPAQVLGDRFGCQYDKHIS